MSRLQNAKILAMLWFIVFVVIAGILGVLYHSFFIGIAVGSILTAIIIRQVLVWTVKEYISHATGRAERIVDEVKTMEEEVNSGDDKT